MQMIGHKTRAMLDRYNIVSDGDLQEAALKLDRADRKTEVAKSPESDTVRSRFGHVSTRKAVR